MRKLIFILSHTFAIASIFCLSLVAQADICSESENSDSRIAVEETRPGFLRYYFCESGENECQIIGAPEFSNELLEKYSWHKQSFVNLQLGTLVGSTYWVAAKLMRTLLANSTLFAAQAAGSRLVATSIAPASSAMLDLKYKVLPSVLFSKESRTPGQCEWIKGSFNSQNPLLTEAAALEISLLEIFEDSGSPLSWVNYDSENEYRSKTREELGL